MKSLILGYGVNLFLSTQVMITLALCNPGDEAVTVITPGEYDLMVILAIPYRIHRVSGEVALLKDIEEPVGKYPTPEVTVRVMVGLLSIGVPFASAI